MQQVSPDIIHVGGPLLLAGEEGIEVVISRWRRRETPRWATLLTAKTLTGQPCHGWSGRRIFSGK
jgi:hypothetical protein